MITLLDGPMGTQLQARGVAVDGPAWSATALDTAPEVIAGLHREYAAAGAIVHTANTFRTKRRAVGERWRELAHRAVGLARASVPAEHRVAGSIAPLEDCYRPDLSPVDPRPEHRELARALAEDGVDILLVETFPHVGEALVAVEEAVATGVETWLALTAGYRADLLTPAEVRAGAATAVERGATVVLVNCVPAAATLAYVEALAGLGVPFGAYANAGHTHDGIGWTSVEGGADRYADHADTWMRAGATVIGTCCGTGPAHVGAIAQRLGAL